MMAKLYGRWGAYEARTPEEKSRARRQKLKRQVARASLNAWLEQHKTCENGCGQPVAFYDTIHYALRYSGCCSAQCESALAAKLNNPNSDHQPAIFEQRAMTNEQFNCCLSNRSGASSEGARLVLVEGKSVEDAMTISGLAESTIRNAMVRIRKRDSEIRAAYCGQTVSVGGGQ